MPDRKYWSTTLRRHLRLAGVTRAELFANDKTRKHLTFHDLKATAITWMAIRGDNPLAIMQRAAHEDFKTTLAYLRAAEMVGYAIGEPFPELPVELLGNGPASGVLPNELPIELPQERQLVEIMVDTNATNSNRRSGRAGCGGYHQRPVPLPADRR